MFPSNPNINDSHIEQNKTFVYNGEGWVLQSDLVLPDGSKWEESGLTQIIPKYSKHIPSTIIDGLLLDAPIDNKTYSRKNGEWVDINQSFNQTFINSILTDDLGHPILDENNNLIITL